MRPDERRAFIRNTFGDDPEAFTPDDLKAIADGPIMDANRLYLPAGRISMAEALAREAALIEVVVRDA